MRMVVVGIILILAVISTYAEVRNNAFIDYDDPMYVTDCKQVQQGLTIEGVRWAFTNYDAANWHPLTWLSHMLDCQCFGQNAGMHHMVNVALHAINALLVLACLSMLTNAFWPSAAAALVWAVHPLRVESVAWISERKDLLSAMFGLLCIMAHVWFAKRPTIGRGFVSWLALALGLMCKPMLVTWPFLLLVLDIWPLRRWTHMGATSAIDIAALVNPRFPMPRLIAEKIPMFAICAASSVLTVQAQRAGGAMMDTTQVAIWPRIANALIAYVRYMSDLFGPHDLAVLYPHPTRWPLLAVFGAASLLAAITFVSIALRRRMPWLLVGWLWFLGTMVPVIGLVQVGAQSMADRYTYLPQLGLLLALTMTVNWMVEARAIPMIVLGAGLSVPLWFQTRAQTLFWRDAQTLYAHALSVTHENWIIQNNMGVQAMNQNRLEEAESHYREALRLRPTDTTVLGNIAEIMARRGNTAEAIRYLAEAIKQDPKNLVAMNNLARLFATAPNPILRNSEKAVELGERIRSQITEAMPMYAAYMDTLGACYASAGRFDEAIAAANAALAAANPTRQPTLRAQIRHNLERYRNRLPAQ